MRQSVAKSIIVRTESVEEAMKFSNEYAPEHLILHLEGAGERVRMVENAGSVFVGPYSPERWVFAFFFLFLSFLSVFLL